MSNYPTLDGLQNIDADSGNLTNITCETFIASTSAQVPTVVAGSNDNNAASTQFVKDAIDTATSTLVTTNTTQTLTSGTKFFTNNPQSLTSAAPTLNNEYTNKLYVDTQISTAGGSFVTLSGALQTITGNKNFTGTTILGNILTADQPCKVSITNNTTSDTSVNGTIGGESVYHQVRFGGRGFYIAQGLTDSGNQYFGVSGGGAPDPEFVLTLRNGVGLKVSNGLDTSSFTEQLKVVGTSKFTGVATFDVPPVSATNPTTATQVCNKQYTDAGNGASILPLNNTFTGNNTFNPATGTTSIRGNQVDIFPTITYLTSPTTSVAGTNFNMNSTTNYVAGTTTYLATTTTIVNSTCNSFYVDASYNNIVGKETYINTPYFLVNTNCVNFVVNALNTNMTGTIATATTQIATDNSTKIATTAYVNNYGNANYMTLTTNQNVSGVKTYSTQQIFNAGLTSNNIYASGTVDTNFCTNMGNGILTLGNSKIICDTFGVRMINLNTQLNEATFIQPNPSLAVGEAPSINFPNNQSANFANTGNAGEADATKQVNIGILKFFCGNNQSSVFTLSHSLTNGYAIGPSAWQEEVLTIQFVDANTGNIKWTSGNLADTALFSMPSLGTVVRPNTSFTLDTMIIPQGVYNIFAYIRIQNAFGSNVLNTVTWNLSASPSTLVTTQDYNTYKDYTFTSRNLYHCFRNYVAGVYIINNIAVAQNIMLPIFYSVTDLTNIMFQPTTTGAVPAADGGAVPGTSGVGNYNVLGCDNKDNYWLVYPNYGLIVYNSAGWTGTVYLNYRNKERNPVVVAGTTIQGATSVKVYFDGVELIKY